MNYYLDTEFHEYKKKPLFGKPIDTIELISIGIVSEDEREYYAVCNEFDLKAAWKNEWLRENVLKPIYTELDQSMNTHHKTTQWSYKGLKRLLKWKGKSKKQIAEDIVQFSSPIIYRHNSNSEKYTLSTPKFHTYYGAYDHVIFCWLFGRMIDSPNGFPMYTIDLKQMLDETVSNMKFTTAFSPTSKKTWRGKEDLEKALQLVKGQGMLTNIKIKYPTQQNKHNALDDAKWNKKLHRFIKTL